MTRTVVSSNPTRTFNRVTHNELTNLRVHLVGIGGSGMSGLASMLLKRGAHVSGSDRCASIDVDRLAERGAKVSTQQTPDAIPPDAELVVASAAIPEDHPERVEARRRGLKTLKYAELLGMLMSQCDGIAVSGTHGKSTTTAWLTYTLKRAGLDPNFVIGAQVPQLGGGSGVGDGPHFVAEACEYDRSFLNLTPTRAVVLNIEEDHLDCYADIGAIRDAFGEFVRRVPRDGLVALNHDDEHCRAIGEGVGARVVTFGRGAGAGWRAENVRLEDGVYAFDVSREGEHVGHARLGIAGPQNVDNALAVIALASDCGVPWEVIQRGLADFRGAQRRLEPRGEVRGVRVLDDYAHHPTEIRVTLQAARERYGPKRLWCVFQPHQHSRTRFLLEDFARSFALADRVVVPDIYFVRDTERDRQAVNAADLVEAICRGGGNATYVPAFGEIVRQVAEEAEPGDVVMTMGAGTIWKVADELVQRLGAHLPE
jgi:UDP-N-acetylmuramate--alanine ligase